MRNRLRTRRRVLVALVAGLTVTLVAAQAMMGDHRPACADWIRLNPQKNFITSAHPTAKDVYVNEIGAEAARTATFPFPEGSELVKESTDTETLTVFVITAMRKVAGFDPDNGDCSTACSSGARTAPSAARGSRPAPTCTRCVSCHVGAAATDYAFLSYTGN